MTYEDPNAPSTALGDVARESSASVDQSKTFLGGQHHPWRRLFARTVDICTVGFALFLLLIFVFSATMPKQAAGFAKAMENPIIASVVLYLIWLPAETLLLSLFGTTPAKWLFGIRVAHPGGNLLSVAEALNRSFLVFVQGDLLPAIRTRLKEQLPRNPEEARCARAGTRKSRSSDSSSRLTPG